MSDLLSAAEAASLLPDTSVQSLQRWARNGNIPSVVLPSGRRFFRREDIEKIITPVMPSASSADEVYEDVPLFRENG